MLNVVSPMPDFAFPLSEFYARTSQVLPRMDIISGDAMPGPYHDLLVHEREMTLTLERFHGSEIYITAQDSGEREDRYFRQVILHRASDDAPVEFGANCANLNLFPADARQLILEEKVPLGRILKDYAITYSIRVPRFFRVEADALISRALNLTSPATLYGRQAIICNSQEQPLSQVIEILPPIPG
jgi:chorismate-pyruvate lyase